MGVYVHPPDKHSELLYHRVCAEVKHIFVKMSSFFRAFGLCFCLGNTAQSAIGASWKNCALTSSLFLEIHKVFLRKSAIVRTQFFSGFALAELCGVAFTVQRQGGRGDRNLRH